MNARWARLSAIATVGIVLASCVSSAATYCVDAARGHAGANGSCVLDGQGRWDAPFGTLGEALTVAQAGDEVWVAQGTYAENGLVVGSGVAVVGGFAGIETFRAQAAPATHAVLVRAATSEGAEAQAILLDPGSRLEGVHVSSGFQALGTAVRLGCPDAGNAAVTELVDSHVSGSDVGVYVPNCDDADLGLVAEGNRIEGNRAGLLTAESEILGRSRSRLTLRKNSWFKNSGAGVDRRTPYSSDESVTTIEADTFIGNGVGLSSAAAREGSNGATISVVNSFLAGNSTGARVDSYSSVFVDATIRNTRFVANPLRSLYDGGDLRVERCSVHGSSFRFYGYSDNSSVTVSNSDIVSSAGIGLEISSTFPTWAVLQGSLVRDHLVGVRHSVGEDGPSRMTISGNGLLDSGSACLVNDHDQLLLAEGNFWGTNSAPEIAACVSGPVDYDPWYWPESGNLADGLPRRVYGRVRVSSDPAFPGIAHDRPGPGSRISVTWLVDSSTSGSTIGSFGGSLRWDPWVVSFAGWEPAGGGFDVVCNESETVDGILRCSGTNVVPSSGEFGLVCATFDVTGPVRWPSPLDVEFTSLFSGASSSPAFEDLTSILLNEDDYLQVATAADYGDVLADGEVDSGDALVLLSREVALPIPPESETRIEEHLGDANGDGLTDSTDANVILSHEIFLPVPRPVGEPNVNQGACDGPVAGGAADRRSREKVAGSASLGLVLDATSKTPQLPFPVRIVLGNRTGERAGSYTAKLTWPASKYRLISVDPGGASPLQRPKTNAPSLETGALRLTAAHPDGDGSGTLVLAIVTLQATGAGANPPKELAIGASAIAGVSPAFRSWLPQLTIAATKVMNSKPR